MTALLFAASTSDKIKTANSMPQTLSGKCRISGITWSLSKSGGILPISKDKLLGHQGSLIMFLNFNTSFVLSLDLNFMLLDCVLQQSKVSILKSFLSPLTEPMRGRRVLLALIIASISISDAILNGPEQRPTEKVLGTTSPLIFRHDEDLSTGFTTNRNS